MAHRSRSSPAARGSAINFRFLIGALLLLAIGGGAAFVVRDYQVRHNADKLRSRAKDCFAENDYAGCQEWLGQYLQLRPEDPEARVLLAQVADNLAVSFAGKARAVRLYEQAIGLSDGDRELRVRKMELLLEIEKFSEAQKDAKELLEASKKQGDPLSREHKWRAQRVQALARYRQLQRIGTRSEVDPTIQALSSALRELSSAIQELSSALTANPGQAEMALELAQHKAELALALAHQAELAPALAQTYRDFAIPPRVGDANDVMEAIANSLNPSSPNPSVTSLLARHRYRRTYHLEGAKDDLQRALKLAPDDVDVLVAQGESLLAARDYPAAIKAFDDLVKTRAKTDRRSYLGLGRAYAESGDRTEALKTWRQAIDEIGRDDVALYLLVSSTLIEEAKADPSKENKEAAERSLADARDVLRRLIGFLSQNQHGRIGDGIDTLEAEYWLAIGQPAKAAPQLARVATSSWESDNFQDNQAAKARRWSLLGACYAAMQQWDLAAVACEKASDLGGHTPQAELAYAVALHNTGRLSEAVGHYESAAKAPGAPAEARLASVRAALQLVARSKGTKDWVAYQRALQRAKESPDGSVELLLIEAEAAAIKGAPQEAVAILDRACEKNARAPDADRKRFLPTAILQYDRWGSTQGADKAMATLRGLKDVRPAQVKAIEAELLIRHQKPDDAQKILEDAAAEPAMAAQLQARLAELALSRGKLEDARRWLRQSHETQPQEPWPLRRLGDLAVQTENADDLKFCEEKLKALEGDDGATWRFLRGIRLLVEHPEAGKTFTTPAKTAKREAAAAQRDPIWAEVQDLLKFLVSTRDRWPPTHDLAARIAEREGRRDDEESECIRAIELGSQSPALYERLSSLLLPQGREGDEKLARYLDRLHDSQFSPKLWEAERLVLVQSGGISGVYEWADRFARIYKNPRSLVFLGQTCTQSAKYESDPEKRERWYSQAETAFGAASSGEGSKDPRAWFGWIWYHMQRRDATKARNAVKEMEKLADFGGKRDSVLAAAYELIGDVAQAELHHEQAVKHSPDDLQALQRQATFYSSRNLDKAKEVYERLYKLKPKSYGATLAAILAASGDKADFQKAMDLLAAEPGDSQVSNTRFKALLLIQQGGEKNDTDAAGLLSQRIEQANKPDPIDRLLLALVYERQKKVAEAQRQYEQIVKDPSEQPTKGESTKVGYLEAYLNFLLRHDLNDEFDQQLRNLQSLDSERYGLRATRLQCRSLKRQKQPVERAVPIVDAYRRTNLEGAKDAPQKARVLLNTITLYDELGLESRVERVFDELIEKRLLEHPYRLYAAWLDQKGRYADAVRLCLKHSANDSSAAGSAVLAGILAAATGRAEPPRDSQAPNADDLTAAERQIAEALQKNPRDRALLFAVGALRHVQGRQTEAEALYRRLMEVKANDPAVLNNLALVLSEEPSRRAQAIQLMNQAIEQVPTSWELKDSLGLVLLNAGQAKEASDMLHGVVAKQKTNRRYLFHLAVAQHRSGDLEGARRSLTQAKELRLREEILTPNERQFLAKLEADLAKTAPKNS